jgi:hypothetical protein
MDLTQIQIWAQPQWTWVNLWPYEETKLSSDAFVKQAQVQGIHKI